MEDDWILVLYRAGSTPVADRALANAKAICDAHLNGHYSIEVVDLLKDPGLAEKDQIFAVPTLVRRHPGPVRKMIGDLSDYEKVMTGMDIYKTPAELHGPIVA
jgi:circadian clock protein KaiB